MDRVADAINTIKTNERIGRGECTLYSTKLIKSILSVLKKEQYIKDYEEFTDKRIKRVKVTLSNRINSIGIIKPRSAVTASDIQTYEMRFIPSRDFGVLLISTSQGLMTNKEAKSKNVGGRLIAYVY